MNSLLEDLLTLGGQAFGNLAGARHEFRAQAQQRLGEAARHLNLVSREEFDAAFAMLAKIRTAQEELRERIAKIEMRFQIDGQTNKSSKNESKKAPGEIKSAAKRNLPKIKTARRHRA